MNDSRPFRSSIGWEWKRSCHRLPANLHRKLQCVSPNVRASNSPVGAPPQSERDDSSDTLLGNRVPVSKPIRITRSRYSCLSSAGKKTSIRDAENRERPRWFFARVQAELLPPAHPQRVERQERFERLRRTRPRGERSAAIERLERLERLEQAPFYGGHTIKRARVCICLMLLVNCL